VEANEEDVVEQEHDCGGLVRDAGDAREELGGDVADVLDLRVLHGVLPQHIARVCPGKTGIATRGSGSLTPRQEAQPESDERPGNPSHNAPAPRQRQNGETNVLAKQQRGRFLP
jgi:hypothetical protein